MIENYAFFFNLALGVFVAIVVGIKVAFDSDISEGFCTFALGSIGSLVVSGIIALVFY